jgi:phage gp29-like protein
MKNHKTTVSEWLIFIADLAIFSAISWREQANFQWDDDDDKVCFVLDQHA